MRVFFILLLFFSFELLAEGLPESKYKYVQDSIGKGKPYFLELGAKSCKSCKIMDKMLYGIKQKNHEYNIHFINVQKERAVAQELRVMMIPTQIIFDKDGKEVYRHIGILGTSELYELFKQYKF